MKKLNRLGGEIAQLDAESQNIEAMRKPLTMSSGPELTSLAQWNARYGTVEKPVPSGFYSGFNDAPKIYGGTEHHRAFKSECSSSPVLSTPPYTPTPTPALPSAPPISKAPSCTATGSPPNHTTLRRQGQATTGAGTPPITPTPRHNQLNHGR